MHENLDKGYIVKQDGFKVIIYTINIINKDEKSYHVNSESGDQLIKLDNENEYNYFKSKLKRIFYPDIVWHEFIKIKAILI